MTLSYSLTLRDKLIISVLVGETNDIFPASPPNSPELGVINRSIQAVENGGIPYLICRGFQPLTTFFSTIPAVGIAGGGAGNISPSSTAYFQKIQNRVR